MGLSPRQQHEVREAVRLLWNELNQSVQELDTLKRLRDTYGTDVGDMLRDPKKEHVDGK